MFEKIEELNQKNGFLKEAQVVKTVLKDEVTCKTAKEYIKKVHEKCADSEDMKYLKCCCELTLAILDSCCKDEDKVSNAVKSKLSDLLICCDVDVEKVKEERKVQERVATNKYFGEWKNRLEKYS